MVFAFILIVATKIHSKTEAHIQWPMFRLSFVGLLALSGLVVSTVNFYITVINEVHISFVTTPRVISFRNYCLCM